ncbi:putative olfactory receptor 52P1 [Rhinatrema bivittatum]|uniref:putative olfactory receptor 52P1 n=1 Tax=Rhinatrema bivittatum TaxID=194408 RepID=UPI00112C42C5|nr:putative olfactory receptor 52P1 [Rhinatrema bivittatum]XP_029457671.1 putative olfactory receptor 52P1 [Rhinatrema bivittatum]
MLSLNGTIINHPNFILLGIPGLQEVYLWLSVPMCSIYLATLLGNGLVLFLIMTEKKLHKPMYLFLSMLLTLGLISSTAVMPKLLCILWFNLREIAFDNCLIQMFIIHSFSAMRSAVLVAMAFDRFIAICNPLRYASILSNKIIAEIGLIVLVRGVALIMPFPLLIQRLNFCRTNVIFHSYCEHIAVAKVACTDISINNLYGLVVALLVSVFDLVCIALSYFLIFRAVLKLQSKEAHYKALNTCAAHICVILIAYVPFLFSLLTHRFGHNVPLYIHILLANFYLLIPAMLNPIVYGMKTKEIWDRILKIVLKRKVHFDN